MLLGRHVDFLPAPYRGTMAAMGSDFRCLGIALREPSAPEVPLIAEVTREYNANVDFPEVMFMRSLSIKKPFRTDYSDRWKRMVKAIKALFDDPAFQAWNKKTGLGLSWTNPQDSEHLVYENKNLIFKHADVFK